MEHALLKAAPVSPPNFDSMDWSNPHLRLIERTPIVPGVKIHPIVSAEGDGPFENGDGGVVAYTSAHLERADSEFVLRSARSCQAHPPIIRDVRRIVMENLQSLCLP